MNSAVRVLTIIVGLLILMTVSGVFFVVQETEQVILTQFGKPVGTPITTAGLKLKAPFIQQVNRIEKRVLAWDGPSAEMPTRDKLYIVIDAFGRWQISDPLQFYLRLRDQRSAQSRLNDILGSEMRNTIARHDLVEVVRTTKGRKPVQDEALSKSVPVSNFPTIQLGRVALEAEVFEAPVQTRVTHRGRAHIDAAPALPEVEPRADDADAPCIGIIHAGNPTAEARGLQRRTPARRGRRDPAAGSRSRRRYLDPSRTLE